MNSADITGACLNNKPTGAPEGQRLAPFQIFRVRCKARALLYAAGELDLQEAVDALQAAAIANGLVAAFDQDAVQLVLSEEFGKVRGDV